jgi:hypothetical protein
MKNEREKMKNPGDRVQVIYFGGQPDPKPRPRIVTKVLKKHIILSDGYKYNIETGRCIGHDYAIVGEEKNAQTRE